MSAHEGQSGHPAEIVVGPSLTLSGPRRSHLTRSGDDPERHFATADWCTAGWNVGTIAAPNWLQLWYNRTALKIPGTVAKA